MPRFYLLSLAVGLAFVNIAVGQSDRATSLLKTHCVKCHGPQKQSGRVRLDNLTADMNKDGERWLAVRDQVRDGLMPPPKEPRLESAQARALETAGRYLQFPAYRTKAHRTMANLYCTLLYAAGKPRDKFGVADPGLKDIDETGPLAKLLA